MGGGGGNKNMLISRGGVEISKFLFPGGGGVEISTALFNRSKCKSPISSAITNLPSRENTTQTCCTLWRARIALEPPAIYQ